MKLSFSSIDEMIGLRLDKALALRPEISTRSRATHLLAQGLVLVNGKTPKSSQQIKSGDIFEIDLPVAVPTELVGFDFDLDILFEDNDIIVLNKPSGLVVHPAAGHAQDTLVNALIHHSKNLSMKFGENRPGIVHRLDKETSGILVVAKNDRAHESLTQQFKERTIHRIYYAVCISTPNPAKGVIESYLARHPHDRKKYATVVGRDADGSVGKWAVTNYEVLKSNSGLSYCKLKLETGRTHQIRVHLSEKRSPIAGDALYGADRKIKSIPSARVQDEVRNLNRFLLHAAELGFTHPTSNQPMLFVQDWPLDVTPLLSAWGLR